MELLHGRRIGILEARRSTELGNLVAKLGGTPYLAPALREEPDADPEAIAGLLDALRAELSPVVVLQTGVGARKLFDAVGSLGREAELRELLARSCVVVRGPKPVAVLRGLGIRIDRQASTPHTTAELIQAMADLPLASRTVVVQRTGEENVELAGALTRRGGRVAEVALYRWALPEDVDPLLGLIDELTAGGLDAVLFTSAAQVANLFAVANRAEKLDDLVAGLAGQTLVAAVGPVCTRALRERGIHVDVQPDPPKMGPLVQAVAGALADRPAPR